MNRKFCRFVMFACLVGLLMTSCSSPEPAWLVEPANKGTVIVLGQTVKQGEASWTPGMTVRQSFVKMGGCTPFADWRHVRLITRTGRKYWQGHLMQERVINVETGKPDVEIPDQSVIILPEKKVTF